VRATTPEGLAEAFRENTLTQVRTRHEPTTPKSSQQASCPVSAQRTSRFRPQPDHLSPQSQSLSQSYGSALPTSLTYIFLTTRGCSPWRPAADMGTALHENHTNSLRFSRADRSTLDTTRAVVLYGSVIPISGQTDSRD
jgi:hypothetical protein